MSVEWPETLPLPQFGLRYNVVDPQMRTLMASGRTISRRRFSDVPTEFSARWMLRQGEAEIFEQFYQDDAVDGSEWIEMPLVTAQGEGVHYVRFRGAYQYRRVGADLWEYSANLQMYLRPAGRRDLGLVWTAHAGSSSGAWESVCWSPELELFVAVGNNAISTSSDGINWTARTSPINSHWRSITWSPELELFVAVASTGAGWAMRSSDGINWTANVGSVTSQWRSICWSPELELFVAVASSGSNRVLASVNGSTWVPNSGIGTSSEWEDVTWSPDLGLFFAIASDDPGTHWSAYSSNGIVWTTQTPGVSSAWRDVIWASGLGGGGAFVAVASEGYTVANQRVVISPDAISWDLFAGSTAGGAWRGVAWAQSVGILAAVASSGSSRLMTSYNGMDWISFSGPAASAWRSICWSPELERFVAVASSGNNRALVGRFN